MTEIADDRSWWADVEHLRPGAPAPTSTPQTALRERPIRSSLIEVDPRWDDGADTAAHREYTGDQQPVAAPAPAIRRGRITGRALPERTEDPVLRRADAASFADAMDLDGAFGLPARPSQSREIVLTGRPAVADEDAQESYDDHGTGAEDSWLDDQDQLWVEPGAPRRAAEPKADLWDDGDELWSEPAPKNPSQAVLWDDDDELWSEPAPRRRHDAGDDHVDYRPAARGVGGPDRKTVRITGNPGIQAELAERRALREVESRRPRSVADRAAHRPDRIAMWAVMLGIFLVLIAATSSSAGLS